MCIPEASFPPQLLPHHLSPSPLPRVAAVLTNGSMHWYSSVFSQFTSLVRLSKLLCIRCAMQNSDFFKISIIPSLFMSKLLPAAIVEEHGPDG